MTAARKRNVLLRLAWLFCWISWDDNKHLVNLIHSESLNPPYLKNLFTSTVNKTYIPLTSVSFAIERKFFVLNPAVHHFTNLLLHLGVIICLFIFSLRLGINTRASAVAVLIFAVHPMHVESVVWITERKDVLYSLCAVLNLLPGLFKAKKFLLLCHVDCFLSIEYFIKTDGRKPSFDIVSLRLANEKAA